MSLELEVESLFDQTSTKLWKTLQNKNTKCLKTEDFRTIISCCQKVKTAPAEWLPMLSELAPRILSVLASGELYVDCQIVASTAYFMILNLFQDPTKISDFFSNKILRITKLCSEISGIKVAKPENFKLSLCHGILQLNNTFWSCSSLNLNNILFFGIFPVVHKLCYEYSALCFLSFRVLANFLRKINNLLHKNDIMPIENFKHILNIVMANWENPLSGVREQNMIVFEQLLLINENYWEFIVPQSPNIYQATEDIKLRPLLEIILVEQSWMMKSKYFLLAAVLPRYGTIQALQVYGMDITSGLLLSLNFVHLVSAGTDLYHVILSRITFQQWQDTFLVHIVSILNQQSDRIQIQNVFSYWIPQTIKKYPDVLELLLDEIKKQPDINHQFSLISLMRLARKEGIEITTREKFNEYSNYLISAIQCYSEPIRSQAFGYLCTSSKTCDLPTDKELDLVKLFLKHNINADNAAFRQNLLNSTITLLVRIRDSCLHRMKQKTADGSLVKNENLLTVFNFINWLHQFLIGNLEYGSNYQRKYTSVLLYKTVLDYLGKNVNITKNTRKSNTKLDGFLICNFGEKIGKWNFTSTLSRDILFSCLSDPADDVRNTVSEILMSHFTINSSELETFSAIFKKGLLLCSSPMFYQAESGALLIQVTTTLTYNLDYKYLEEILRNVDIGKKTVVSVLLIIAEKQTKELKNDLLYAASRGSPVHGILTALEALLTDKSSIEFMKLTCTEQEKLISLLETIVKYILNILASKSSSNSEFAPSFGEMGLAVSAAVQGSSLASENDKLVADSEVKLEVNVYDDAENLHLTPAEQLVLNCMWLNIKVCCSLASSLVVSSCLNTEETIQCTELLCLVLRKCRHKGAIESAGVALNRVTRYLTASDKPQLKCIPQNLLAQFLQTLVSAKAATVSRRSAGLAILIHQLVSADMENGKPLLHKCVSSLIELISSGEIPPNVPLADLPQSQALHFLRTLVQDSSLRQDMTSYMLDISLLCFENLSSPIWTLRNAALQLFGALIPKLIGQKKQQEEKEFSSGYHVAYEELFHHVKPLFELIKKELKVSSITNSLQLHSKLMPVLTLLCNLTVNMQSLLNTELKEVLCDFSKHFKSLFKSDIYSIRKLSAKASAWFCFPSEIVDLISDRIKDVTDYILVGKTICNENELHGYLLNIKYIIERFNEEKVGMSLLLCQEEKLNSCLYQLTKVSDFLNKTSFISQALICSLNVNNTVDPLSSCKEIVRKLSSNCVSVGMPYWVNLYLKSAMQFCDINKLPNVLKFCLLDSQQYELQNTIIKIFKTRMKNEKLSEHVDDVMGIIVDFINTGNSDCEIVFSVLETLLLIFQKNEPNIVSSKIIMDTIYSKILFQCQLGNKCSAVSLPVICAFMYNNINAFSPDTIRDITTKIRLSTDPLNNEDIRLNASKCLSFVFPILVHLKGEFHDKIGYDIWQSTVNLLQDEDSDIRLETSKFVSSLLASNETTWNPYISLEFVFKRNILQIFMPEVEIVKCLWSKLKCDSDFNLDSKDANINPFDHGYSNNIYEEENIIIDFVGNSLLEIVSSDNINTFTEIIKSDQSDLQLQCVKILNCIQSNKNISYICFKKILAQLKIIIITQKNISEMENIFKELEKYRYNVF